MARRVIETPIPDDQARRLLLHNAGTQQTKARWDPDNVAFSDFGSNDTPVGQYDTEQGGWPLVTESGGALAVTRGLAEAGPWFTETEMWLNQAAADARLTGTIPSGLSTTWTYTLYIRGGRITPSWSRLMYMHVNAAQASTLFLDSGGSLRWYPTTNSPSTTSGGVPWTLLGISQWDDYYVQLRADGTAFSVWISTDGTSWTAAGSTTDTAATPRSGGSLFLGSFSSSAGCRAVFRSATLLDGDENSDPAMSFTPDLFIAGNRANADTATDAQGNTWTITRPDWAASTDIGRRFAARDRAHFWLPGLAGQYLSTPDSAANSITGDLEIEWSMGPEGWAPPLQASFISKYGSTHSGPRIDISTAGTITFFWSTDGGAPEILSMGIGGATPLYAKLTHDVDDGAGNNVVRIFGRDSPDDDWVQLASVTTVGTTSHFDSAEPWITGVLAGASAVPGYGPLHYVRVRDGIDGTTVVNFDAADADPDAGSWVDPVTSSTVTINRTTSANYHLEVIPAATEAWQSDGANDYLTVIGDDSAGDFDPSDGLSALVDVRMHSGAGSSARLLGNTDSTDDGFSVLRHTTNERIYASIDDGTTAAFVGDNADNITYGQRAQFTAAFGSSDQEAYVNGSSVESASGAVLAEPSSFPIHLGRAADGSGDGAATFFGFAVIKRRLTDTDVSQIASEGLIA